MRKLPIFGREKEKQELDTAYATKEAELIAVYGRRRVGKTFLIRNFFLAKKCIYFQITGIKDGQLIRQLENFASEVGSSFYQGAPIKTPDNWVSAFNLLTEAIKKQNGKQKIVLFFDELPWLATHKSGLLQALEYTWNRYWSNNSRIKLIVCGSSASWIIKKIIRNRGGLHNRVTKKIRLKAFNLNETAAFLKKIGLSFDIKQTIKVYFAIGGVPFYLKQLQKSRSIDQNINNLLFKPDGIFFNEFEDIFYSLFENAKQYLELINIIGKSSEGMMRKEIELKNKLTGKGGSLTNRLENLELAGFIISYIPFGREKRGTTYRIYDEFCYFYLTWIKDIKSKLKHDENTKYWLSCLKTPRYYAWMGYAFENLCYKHLTQVKKCLEVDDACLASRWIYSPKAGKLESINGAQIDLLLDRQDDAITICEIKYSEKPFVITKDYAEKIRQKLKVFKSVTKTTKQLFIVFIAANGLKKNKYSDELVSRVVTLEDLFQNI